MDDIARFLKTGHNKRTAAYGPMAEVVSVSTSKLTDPDLHDIATYIKSLPGTSDKPTAQTPGKNVMDAGAAIYADQCSACHQKNGEGVKGVFPTLKGDSVVQSKTPMTVVRLILNGGHGAWTKSNPDVKSMPTFGWKLSDNQIASVATFVRNSWGNSASVVTSGEVHDLRKKVEAVSSAN